MKKTDLLLPLTTLATAALMAGFISLGFLIIQSNASLPDTQRIKSVELKIPLRVYSAEGLLISEFGNERRKPIAIADIPPDLINSVLASEDDGFYRHSGIDLTGLIRAAVSNFRSGQTLQGASTITMQVARNFFLSPEKTYTRKLREVLLAIKLEQILSKDEILSLYLNKIFLGHRAYGFGAAAEVYYGRELNQLTLAETAMLAGLPKAPSSYNPLSNPVRAKIRRDYVLGRLKNLGKISKQTYLEGIATPLTAKKHIKNTQLEAPHIAEMVRAKLVKELGEQAYWDGLSVYTTVQANKQKAAELALRAGLQAYDRRHGYRGAVARIDLNQTPEAGGSIDSRNDYYSKLLSNYPSSHEQIPALITATDKISATAYTRLYGEIILHIDGVRWARRHLTANQLGERPTSMAELLGIGDIVYIQPISKAAPESAASDLVLEEEIEDEVKRLAAAKTRQWRLSQIPNISGALISMEPSSGRILSLVGGYDFFLNKFNRAVQSIRQPGSNIKPFIYSASLNKGFTPATLVSGAPIVMTDPAHGTVWRPENYSGKFFGPTRIRVALSKSLNLVSIRLLRAVGITYVRDYLQRFRIDMRRFSPTLTMALGTGGITPLEMLAAYSTLANTGYRVKPYFIDHITDRTGKVVYRAPQPEFCDECYLEFLPKPSIEAEALLADDPASALPPRADTPDQALDAEEQLADSLRMRPNPGYVAPRVMTKANNFLTVSMLKDVIRHGTGRKALALNRQDLAGKTGTTNDYVDAWFTGFNSSLATTVWVGFDEPTSLGRGEAGSVAALPIWIDYMRSALADIPQDSQELPVFIEQGRVNRITGKRSDEFDPNTVLEYFPIPELLDFPLTELDQHELELLTDEDSPPIEALEAEETVPLDDQDLPLDDAQQQPSPEPRIIEEEEDTEGLF